VALVGLLAAVEGVKANEAARDARYEGQHKAAILCADGAQGRSGKRELVCKFDVTMVAAELDRGIFALTITADGMIDH
jgi:hypothetical protein